MSAIGHIQPEIHKEIMRRLSAAEKEHDVTIIYACESGSRAWGFPSPDSDYDVRFIYVRKSDWYLSFDVERKRDVIEYPIVDEIDCNGWDLKKALYLLTRTNGALMEWLNSPIKYIELGDTASQLRAVAPSVANSVALCYHYSHMARSNAREYLFKERVKLKKYFYVLRPLFAIRYIEQGLGIPPVEFDQLVTAVAPDSIKPDIERLLTLKRKTPELGEGDAVQSITAFVQSEMEKHGERFHGQGRPDLLESQQLRDQLNLIFRSAIEQR